MKKLIEILKSEEEKKIIEKLAVDFGFKNIRFFIENIFPTQPMCLNLLVDVDDMRQGNANYAHLLETKLIQQLGMDISVMVDGKVTDPLHQAEIKNGSFPLYASLEDSRKSGNAQFFDKIEVKDGDTSGRVFDRQLRLAEEILSKRAKTFVSESVVPAHSKKSSSEMLDVFLAIDNKTMVKKILIEVLSVEQIEEILRKFQHENTSIFPGNAPLSRPSRERNTDLFESSLGTEGSQEDCVKRPRFNG